MDGCVADTCVSRCCIGHLQNLPEDIRIGIFQLAESSKSHLKCKIVLSSLMDIANMPSIPNMPSTTNTKIKKVLLFGDISEYLDLPRMPDDDVCTRDNLILGILSDTEHGQNKKLTPEEKHLLEDCLTESIYKKNQSILKIFDINQQSFTDKSRERVLREMKELPHSLRSICDSCSHDGVKKMNDEIVGDIHRCYEELNEMYILLANFVESEVGIVDPAESAISELNRLEMKGVVSSSSVLLSSLEREFHSSEGAEALRVIGAMQKEERQRKKSQLISLRDEVAKYEELMDEGFGGLLKEYSLVEEMLNEKEGLLKEFLGNSTFSNSTVAL